MKIAILVPLFLPNWVAGTEIATYHIARHLAKRSHEVHVMTSLDKGLPQESREQGFWVHRLAFPKARFFGVLGFWLRILMTLRRLNPDIIHVQSTTIGIPAVGARKLLGKPYVVWGRGSDIYLPWGFKGTISKLVLRNAGAVIALTEDMKREMQKIYPREVLVIPNGIDLERFRDLPRVEVGSNLPIEEGRKLVLFVGKIHPIKGLRYLIEAMVIVRQRERSVRLALVGDGEEREKLTQLTVELGLADIITFVGKVPNETIPEYMAASDIFVLPSLSEGFPVVVLEAMASGLPVVASRVGGLPEIVKDGQNGFLVKPQNSAEIAEKILLLLEDQELRGRISKNNKEKAKSYSWETIIHRLEKVYQAARESSKTNLSPGDN